jgi:hypothetical protein
LGFGAFLVISSWLLEINLMFLPPPPESKKGAFSAPFFDFNQAMVQYHPPTTGHPFS